MDISQRFPPFLERNRLNLVIGVLLIILYAPVLAFWVDGWLNKSISIEHEYFSHGLIGIPYAFYVAFFLNRRKWLTLPDKTHPLAFIFVIVSLIFYVTGVYEFVFLSLPLILAGWCLLLKGIPGLKLQGFPLLLLLLATPNEIPYLITPYTLWLQKFIAGVAGFILLQFGLDVTINGIYLEVNGQSVEVAPYCAGLKMLFTSLYVTLMILHWSGSLKSVKKTLFMLVGAALISVTANIARNATLAWFHGVGNEAAFDALHEGSGGDLYSAIMLLFIVGLHWLMNWVTEPSSTPVQPRSASEEKIEP